jgi:dTDP-4-dehydrorhamnose reductase
VFSGGRGLYSEIDRPDAFELYGISKYLGEVDAPNTITIRTSVIGHEMESSEGLLEWFLAQKTTCKGFSRAFFSGLPTVTLAKVVRDYVLEDETLTGLYHVASSPIDKCSLLEAIAKIYKKNIRVVGDDSFIIDRSLTAEKFSQSTGYVTPSWYVLLREMYNDFEGVGNVQR